MASPSCEKIKGQRIYFIPSRVPQLNTVACVKTYIIMFQVKVEDGKIFVTVNKSVSTCKEKDIHKTKTQRHVFAGLCCKHAVCFLKSLKLTRRVKDMCTRVPENKHTIVLVGGGRTPDIGVDVTLFNNSY